VIFTLTGEDTAEATNMAIITGSGSVARKLSETGIYTTSFVKTSGGWKMAKRIFYSDAR
jgi:hypothetical protein